MEYENELFKVEFTDQCIEEMTEIYDYIVDKLKAYKAAENLINEVNDRVIELGRFPELYTKIGKADRLKRDYHRILIKNYVLLYTIDYEKRKVLISRMIYGRRNYLR